MCRIDQISVTGLKSHNHRKFWWQLLAIEVDHHHHHHHHWLIQSLNSIIPYPSSFSRFKNLIKVCTCNSIYYWTKELYWNSEINEIVPIDHKCREKKVKTSIKLARIDNWTNWSFLSQISATMKRYHKEKVIQAKKKKEDQCNNLKADKWHI